MKAFTALSLLCTIAATHAARISVSNGRRIADVWQADAKDTAVDEQALGLVPFLSMRNNPIIGSDRLCSSQVTRKAITREAGSILPIFYHGTVTVTDAEHGPHELKYVTIGVQLHTLTGTYETWATSLGANNACSPLPNTTPDLSAKLVLVHPGGCFYSQKIQNAAARGGQTFVAESDASTLPQFLSFVLDDPALASVPWAFHRLFKYD